MTARQHISAGKKVSRHFSFFLAIIFLVFSLSAGCKGEKDDPMGLLFGAGSLMGIDTGTAPGVSYTGSPFTLLQNTAVTALTPALTGSKPTSCASSTSLPAGLSINNTTCAISGTPTTVQGAADYTITATNAYGSGQATISITVEVSYTIGGKVSGLLSGTSVVLQNNGGDAKTVNTDGNFTFVTPVASGSTYNVTVSTQPANTRCIVQSGSGTASADVSNIVVICPVAVKNSLFWMRCTHGQSWNAAAGDCTGTNPSFPYGAVSVQYCDINDDSCNDAIPAGEDSTVYGHLNGSGTSGAWNACQSLNTANGGAGTYGITTWRVPKKSELKGIIYCSTGPDAPLADELSCNADTQRPTIDMLMFPNTIGDNYWTSSAKIDQPVYAWYSNFYFGNTYFGMGKANTIYVRCVSGP